MSTDLPTGSQPARVAFYNDPNVRSIVYQAVLLAVILLLVAPLTALQHTV